MSRSGASVALVALSLAAAACSLLLEQSENDTGPDADADIDGDGDGDADGDSDLDADGDIDDDVEDATDAEADGDPDQSTCTDAGGCPEDEDPCTEAVCTDDGCGQAPLGEGSPCQDGARGFFCIGGSCLDCTAEARCDRPGGCPPPSACDVDELWFGEVQALDGIGEGESNCGFVWGRDHLWRAICSRPDPSSYEGSRQRPHVFTSEDGVAWEYGERMVDNPSGYWRASAFVTNYTEYFQHTDDFPIQLNDDSFLVVSANYFFWDDGQWAWFVAYWTSPGFVEWTGYEGAFGSGDYFVSQGDEYCDDCGTQRPSVHQNIDGTRVAWVREQPNVTHHPADVVRRHRFHRLVSDAPIAWEEPDAPFDALVLFPEIAAAGGRFFAFADDFWVFSFFSSVGDGTCPGGLETFWVRSADGLPASFVAGREQRWSVEAETCGEWIDPCEISTPFFAREGDEVRIFYKRTEGESVRWETARSAFVVPGCRD